MSVRRGLALLVGYVCGLLLGEIVIRLGRGVRVSFRRHGAPKR